MESYYKRNREKVLAYGKKYKQENKDKIKQWSITYIEKHKEAIAIKNKQRRLDNIEIYRERERNSHKKSPESTRRRQLKRDYDITLEEFTEMFNEQRGECAICGIHQDNLKQNLCIDHNHKTGKIRGLLCHGCNLVLGNCYEAILVLEKSIEYLKKHS